MNRLILRTNQDELQLKYYDELIYNSTISQENGDRLGSNNTLDDEKSYTQKIDDIYSTNQVNLNKKSLINFSDSLMVIFSVLFDDLRDSCAINDNTSFHSNRLILYGLHESIKTATR